MRILPVMVLLASMAVPHTLYAGDDSAPPVPALYEGKSAAEWAKLLTVEDVATRKRAAYALWKLGPDAGQAALPLVQAIRDTDPYVRATSAKAVERIGSDAVRPVLDELVAEIVDPRPEVSHEAVTLLWRLGPLAAEVVPGLRKGLASEDPVVRANAAAALGNAGDAAKPAVGDIEKLLADRDEAVRSWSAKALARIDPARAFASEKAEVRLAALKTWGEMVPTGKPWTRLEIVTGVLACMKDSNEEIRGWATHTLDNYAVFAGADAPTEWLEIFKRVLEKERAPAIRATGAFGLARYKEHAAEVVPLLAAATDCGEPEVERAAVLGLGWLRGAARPAVPAILAAMKRGDADTRDAGAVALGGIGDGSPPVIEALADMLHSDSRFGPRNAATSLGIVGKGSARAVEALVALVKGEETDRFLRADAARALGKIGGKEAVAALGAWFDSSTEVPAEVCGALCAMDAPQSAKAMARLIVLVKDPSNPFSALACLRELGPKGAPAAQAVAGLLTAKDVSTLIGAANTLQTFGPAAKEVLPALEAAAKDGNAEVVAAVKAAIDAIRQEPKPPK